MPNGSGEYAYPACQFTSDGVIGGLLVPIHGPSLARLGVTAELASGSDYAASQLWSRALWEHSDQPDGILYRCRHDDSALSVAVYDRAKDALAIVGDRSLSEDAQQLARLLKRYDLGLTN